MPRGEPDFRLVRANAWDGSGLAWEWRGRIESVHIEIQLRSLGRGNRYLGLVHREGRFAGWFEVQAPGEAAEH
jgi:hypothetical protein